MFVQDSHCSCLHTSKAKTVITLYNITTRNGRYTNVSSTDVSAVGPDKVFDGLGAEKGPKTLIPFVVKLQGLIDKGGIRTEETKFR